MEWIFLVSTLIGLVTEVANTIGNSNYQIKANNNKLLLNRLKQSIDEGNISDNKIINTLSTVIGNLNQMRYTLDPRIIKKLDNVMGDLNAKINEANSNIQKRTSSYEQAVASIPDNLGGILGLGAKDVTEMANKYDKAERRFQKLKKEDPSFKGGFTEADKQQRNLWDQIITGESDVKKTDISNINNVNVTNKQK